jgi:hypothetical protein
MSSPPSLTWFLLLDSDTGESYKATTADIVSLPPGFVIAQFRDAVKKKDKDDGDAAVLTPFKSSQLLVYKNKAAFDKRNAAVGEGKEEPLEVDTFIHGLGASEEEALVVAIPSSRSSRQSSSGSSVPIKEPHPERKQRWIELNKILEKNAKKSKTNDSTAYSSYVTWNQVETVFNLTNYVQKRRTINDNHLNFFKDYLSKTTKCFKHILTGKEAMRRIFIAPVLICVCDLFEGDIEIAVEKDLNGQVVKAHGHFDFVLRRGNKAVCIVEAKNDINQGMALDLVGCEVAAELGGLDIVYGIVTDYIKWILLRSLNDKVEKDECVLATTQDGPTEESLKEIAEKIYGMLSNE